MAISEFVPKSTLSAHLCVLHHWLEWTLCNRSLRSAQDLNVEGPLLHELNSGFALAANVYFPALSGHPCSLQHETHWARSRHSLRLHNSKLWQIP